MKPGEQTPRGSSRARHGGLRCPQRRRAGRALTLRLDARASAVALHFAVAAGKSERVVRLIPAIGGPLGHASARRRLHIVELPFLMIGAVARPLDDAGPVLPAAAVHRQQLPIVLGRQPRAAIGVYARWARRAARPDILFASRHGERKRPLTPTVQAGQLHIAIAGKRAVAVAADGELGQRTPVVHSIGHPEILAQALNTLRVVANKEGVATVFTLLQEGGGRGRIGLL